VITAEDNNSLHHATDALTAENKSLASDLQYAKAVAALHMGGGL